METINKRNDTQQVGDVLFYAVPLNDCVVHICEGIIKLRNAQVNPFNDCELICHISETNQLILDMQKLGVDVEAEARERIRLSQIQLFIYLLYVCRKFRNTRISLDLEEFFTIRGLRRRSENMQRLVEDLDVLQSITISLIGKKKKQTYYAMGPLLQYNKKGREILVTMGDWIQNLSTRAFTLIHRQFFQYHSKHEWISGMLSLKFAQLSKFGKQKVKIGTLFNFLGITNAQVKKQGCQYYKQVLDHALSLLNKEGYQFTPQAVIYNNAIKFSESLITFQNVYVMNSVHPVNSETKEILSENSVS